MLIKNCFTALGISLLVLNLLNPAAAQSAEPTMPEIEVTSVQVEAIDTEQPVADSIKIDENAAPVKTRGERKVSAERESGRQPGTETASSSTTLLKIVISLALVVSLVVVLGWLYKKMSLRLPGNRQIKIISSIPLGQRERILVIEIQGKQRVIGVTPHSINLLFELENPLPEEKLASDFHTQLQSFLKK